MDTDTRHALSQKAFVLAAVTVGYNVLEAVLSLFFAFRAGSAALAGFGLDSVVESLSGAVMLWRFGPRHDPARLEEREETAARLVGATFFLFGAWVVWESGSSLLGGERPEASLPGMVIAAISMLAMPLLYRLKLDVGRRLGSRALIADARETLACFWLSVSLLAGLGLNWLFGAWWADPAAGLVIAWFLFREGREVFSGEECSCGADDDDEVCDEGCG